MDDMENKLNSILGNPEMMGKIMSLAQSFSQSESGQKPESPPPAQASSEFPEIDLAMLQKLSGYAKQSGIDKNQQSLLRALGPYLSRQRISKLEKAMRAAKMASMASSFLGRSHNNTGR